MITHSVLVFVDWDSARRIVNSGPTSKRRRPERDIEDAVEALQDEVVQILPKQAIHRVAWRFYHGWHEGTTATQDRRQLESFVNQYGARRVGKVTFGRDFAFGDQMLGSSHRLPLRFTLRRRSIGRETELDQKMVDTALVSDLLQAARSGDYDRLIVIGDDDDLLPGLLVAETWSAHIHLLRLTNQSALPLLAGRDRGFPMSMMRRREA